jgi:hypothetical protein
MAFGSADFIRLPSPAAKMMAALCDLLVMRVFGRRFANDAPPR